jgi:hypothetical protein
MIVRSILAPGFEKAAVSSRLEDEVQSTEQEESDGGTTRQNQDAVHFLSVVRPGMIVNGIELREG